MENFTCRFYYLYFIFYLSCCGYSSFNGFVISKIERLMNSSYCLYRTFSLSCGYLLFGDCIIFNIGNILSGFLENQ